MLLLGNPDPSNAVTWDTNNHLTFAVPFQDMKPNIYLGKVLLRQFHMHRNIFQCVSSIYFAITLHEQYYEVCIIYEENTTSFVEAAT